MGAMIVDKPEAEYVVVLRARSSARFLPEEGWELNLDSVPGLGLGAVRVRAFTRWAPYGESSVPSDPWSLGVC